MKKLANVPFSEIKKYRRHYAVTIQRYVRCVDTEEEFGIYKMTGNEIFGLLKETFYYDEEETPSFSEFLDLCEGLNGDGYDLINVYKF